MTVPPRILPPHPRPAQFRFTNSRRRNRTEQHTNTAEQNKPKDIRSELARLRVPDPHTPPLAPTVLFASSCPRVPVSPRTSRSRARSRILAQPTICPSIRHPPSTIHPSIYPHESFVLRSSSLISHPSFLEEEQSTHSILSSPICTLPAVPGRVSRK